MNAASLSDQSLKDLHSLISETLTADDALSSDKKKWGVRKHPDWRRQANQFEAEMRKRKIPFMPIKWD